MYLILEGGVQVGWVGDGERVGAGAKTKTSENLGTAWGGEQRLWPVGHQLLRRKWPEVVLQRCAGHLCGGLVMLSLESKGELMLLR